MSGERTVISRAGIVTGALCVVALCEAACGQRRARSAEVPSSSSAESEDTSAVQGRLAQDARGLPSFDVDAGPDDLRSAQMAALGSSKETPVPACGTTHSYDYIASDVRCDDGRSPFLGDIRAAMGTRAGSVGAGPGGHIVDLYEVPCPEGVKQIYVDMYDCENASPTSSEFEIQSLMLGVLGGDYDPYIRRCHEEEAKRSVGRVSVLLQSCISGMPGVLDMSGDRPAATAWLKEWCAGADADNRDGEPERFVYLDNVIESELNLSLELAKDGRSEEETRAELTGDFVGPCAVDRAAFERWRSTRADS